MRKGLVIASFGMLVGPIGTTLLVKFRPDNPPDMTFFFLSLLASFFLSAILFFPSWMSWHFSVFVITNQRFIQITQKGFFHRSVVDLGLNQIQMVNYQISGLQETVLGFGTIMVQTYVGDLVIHEVHHPARIQKKILRILREQHIELDKAPVETVEQ
jgi:Bacterial PH domain